MTGEQKIAGITIHPDVVDPDDVEMLQDLIMAAIRTLRRRLASCSRSRLAR